MSIKSLKYQRLLAMVFAGASLGMVYFWWQFFNAKLFVIEDLKPLFKNVESYYDWKMCFFMPEIVLGFSLMGTAFLLWFDRLVNVRGILVAVTSCIAILLGMLGLHYGFSTGLYAIEHAYASDVLSADLSITVVGIVGLCVLFCQKYVNASIS